MRAVCLLNDGPNYRRADFMAGLQAVGYTLTDAIKDPHTDDVLVIWNRGGARDVEARRFEACGARVLVTENGYLGKIWQGKKWFSLALGHHAGAGTWPDGGPGRWDAWGAEMAPWHDGRETVILEQRGIGEPGIAAPKRWAESVQERIGGRIRLHPGASMPAVSLVDDLKDAACVATWNSGAALHALLLGTPVFYAFPQWIGAAAARPLNEFSAGPLHADRLEMFRRLAWAMWTAEEVKSGQAFAALLS